MKSNIYSFVFIIVLSLSALSQNRKIDSLRKVISSQADDTSKVKNLINLAKMFRVKSMYDSCVRYSEQSFKISSKMNYLKGTSLHYSNMGIVFYEQGQYPEALQNHFKALDIRESMGDSMSVANTLTNIGVIYDELQNYDLALKNYQSALRIDGLTHDTVGMAGAYNNIGNIYYDKKQYTEALKYHFRALEIRLKFSKRTSGRAADAKKGLGASYNNIGNVYKDLKKYDEALLYYAKALEVKKEVGDKRGIVSSSGNISTVFIQQKRYREAEKLTREILSLAEEIGVRDYVKDFYSNLVTIDSAQGNYKKAFEDYKLYIACRDSVINEDITKKTTQIQMQHEFDKKEARAKAEQEKKEELAKQESALQALIRNFFIAGFALMFIMALLILRSYRIKQKANKLVSMQKELLQEKNKEITDSILYAKRIQNAHLPSKEYISKKMTELKKKV